MNKQDCVSDLLSADVSFSDMETEIIYIRQSHCINLTVGLDESLYQSLFEYN